MNSDFKPLVSVIVPVYRVEKYIENCLNSLIAQTYDNWEAILVDDGSPDRSGEICNGYAARDSRFRVIHKQNGGLSSARNTAIPKARGKYIFFLDSDDFLHYETLESLVNLAEDTDSDIAQCGFVRGNDNVFPEFEKGQFSIYDNHSIFTSYTAKIIIWGKLFKTEVIGNIRFPEGLINEDDFTTWKFYYNAKRIAITSSPFYYYTVNPCSIMASQQRKPNLKYFDAYRERIAFFAERGELDLEAVSRIQWMKSLVMLYANPQLLDEERAEIKSLFRENYNSRSLRTIKIPMKLNLVFKTFSVMPMRISRVVKRLYKAGV